MEALRKSLESLGFRNVKTILASGNVVFESPETNGEKITKKIEERLERDFGFFISVIVRLFGELEEMNGFFGQERPGERQFVTFLAEKPKVKAADPRIVKVFGSNLFAVLGPDQKTVDYMAFLDRQFGKNTTRNWNTIEKILKA